jgi:hypothetical protein
MQKMIDGSEVTAPVTDSNEAIISQNSKLNYHLAPGFAAQIKNSPALARFHLVNYRMNGSSWKKLGKALGQATSLKQFTC